MIDGMDLLKEFNVTLHTKLLSNGVPFVYFEREGMPLNFRIHFQSGARFDPEGQDGVAHFSEHMLLMGTKKFPTVKDLSEFVDRLGGGYNAFTSKDAISVTVSIGEPDDIEQLVLFLDQVAAAPRLTQDQFDNVRDTVIQEYRDKKANPLKMLYAVWERLFFQGTPHARQILGTEESLNTLTLRNIQNHVDSMVTRPFIVIGAGGTPFERAINAFEDGFSLAPHTPEPIEPIALKHEKRIDVETYGGRETVDVLVGFETLPWYEPDHVVLDLMKNVLGGSRASRLQYELRYKKGYVYATNAMHYSYYDSGAFMSYASCSKSNLPEVLKIIREEYAKLMAITEDELQLAKDLIVKSQRLSMQTSAAWVSAHLTSASKDYEDIETIQDYVDHIEAVSIDDTKRVFEKYIRDANFLAIGCGDVEESDLEIAV